MIRFITLILAAVFLLGACSGKPKSDAVGFWQNVNTDRTDYVNIEVNGESYIVTVYGGNSWDGELEKTEMAASLKDGVLTITRDFGDLGLLYKKADDQLVVGGKTTYKRAPIDLKNEAEVKLDEIAKSKKLCKDLRKELSSKYPTAMVSGEARVRRNAFVKQLKSRAPEGCRIF